MSNKHDLFEFALAKEITKDLPQILKIIEEMKTKLEPHKKYRDVGLILNQLIDSEIMLQLQLGLYQRTVDTKGKIE